nr:hypothetical protein [uncultured Mucilaginibacter sp.]
MALNLKPAKVILLILLVLISFASARAQRTDEPPTVKELVSSSFQISRTALITRIISSDSLMIFKAEGAINGVPNYIGIDNYKSYVQLIGDDNNLNFAKFTYVFTTNHDINKLQYLRMSYFVFSIAGKQGIDWFYGPSGKFSKNPVEPISEHKELGFLNADFKYDPKDKAMSITFTPR